MAIELVKKSSWEDSVQGKIIFIDDNPAKQLALIASEHCVAIFNYSSGTIGQKTSYVEKIFFVSLHPNGNHVIVGCSKTKKLLLANILADKIHEFADIETQDSSTTSCKFNKTGALFATGGHYFIDVYNFVLGHKINSINCNGTLFSNIAWGHDSTIQGTSHQGDLLCRWDLNGIKTGEFHLTTDRILGSSITSTDKTLIVSPNFIRIFSRDLIQESEVKVTGSVCLTGPTAVSGEDLVFAATNAASIRIFCLASQEQFEAKIKNKAVTLLSVSCDGRFLMTNEELFTVKDHRGYNKSIITACDDLDMHPVKDIATKPDVMVKLSYLKDQSALLNDAQTRLEDLNLMNDLELKTTKDGISASFNKQQEEHVKKLSTAKYKLDALRHEKDVVNKQCFEALNAGKASCKREILDKEKETKHELLKQVKIYYDSEQAWEEEKVAMDKKMQQMIEDQDRELQEFRVEVEGKLSRQQTVVKKLLSEKNMFELQSNEAIAQLEEDMRLLVNSTRQKINADAANQLEMSQQLMLENGILTRKLGVTQTTIHQAKEQVAMMLDQSVKSQKNMRQKETEKRKYEDQLRAKDLDLLSKQSAAERISTIHSNLLKARSIEEDRIEEAKWECAQMKEKTKLVEEKIKQKQAIMESQMKDTECTKKLFSEVNSMIESIESKKKKVSALNHNLESKIKTYHLALEDCLQNIQNPAELQNKLSHLCNSFSQSATHSGKNDKRVEIRNDITIRTMELKTELEELKSVEALLMKTHKEERQLQIERNARILETMSRERATKNTKGQRYSETAVSNNMKRIQALRGALRH